MTRKAATHRGLIGWGNVVLEQFRADAIRDCYRRAAEARRIADAASKEALINRPKVAHWRY
jgi:hypothetical protein